MSTPLWLVADDDDDADDESARLLVAFEDASNREAFAAEEPDALAGANDVEPLLDDSARLDDNNAVDVPDTAGLLDGIARLDDNSAVDVPDAAGLLDGIARLDGDTAVDVPDAAEEPIDDDDVTVSELFDAEVLVAEDAEAADDDDSPPPLEDPLPVGSSGQAANSTHSNNAPCRANDILLPDR